ncbi:MAG: pilus assembly protein N-terminal domain-containing protein [Desulfobacterium sp.]|nr:pilus assembly protein N-terminal domain-containing protein [Desulfobacterium sp.]
MLKNRTICFIAMAVVLCLVSVSMADTPSQQIRIEMYHSHLMETEAPIIRASIADPKVADVKVLSPTQLLLIAKSKRNASTTLILWEDEDKVATYDIFVFSRIDPSILDLMASRVKAIAPGVSLEIMPAKQVIDSKSIILKGEVSSQVILERVLTVVESFGIRYFNLINLKGPQQVQLKVVIAEVSKSGLKQMGVNFLNSNENLGFGLFKGGISEGKTEFKSAVDYASPRITETTSVGGKDGDSYEITIDGGKPIISTSASQTVTNTIGTPFTSAFQIALNSTKHNWLGYLSLLKGQGLARSLATPTLVAMSGQKAEFQVGGSYPINSKDDKGNITTEMQAYGIILKFTPFLLDGETITLEVNPEVSYPDFSFDPPGLSSRQATTTLQLKDGQSFAMAGLLKEESSVTKNKIPFLGDLPFLGSLFTSKENKHSETELVIMVTPRIVRAMNPDEIPDLPGHDIKKEISDVDFFIKNSLGLVETKEKTIPEFKGKTGFSK